MPYVYPVCPLNMNHAKMFVVADVYARYLRTKDEEQNVIFSVASHFSGNTAQAIAAELKEYFDGAKNEDNLKTYHLYKNIYKVPHSVIKEFVDPQYIMSYFHSETLWELKNLGVSCDYNAAYTTKEKDFSEFVCAIINCYKEAGMLVVNKNNELAINYSDKSWRERTELLIKNTEIKKDFQRNNILSVFQHLSAEWEMLRNSGFGVGFQEDGLIIDPMFDSELLTIYDLYNYWKVKNKVSVSSKSFFVALMHSIKQNHNMGGELSDDERFLIDNILKSLPCEIFFGEEHLKNWLGKKFFAEELLLHPDNRTKSYRILGMGMLDGKRMSASRGHAIFSGDLIKEYGGNLARLIILLSGGNISKAYNYDYDIISQSKKMLNDFSNYWIYLCSDYNKSDSNLYIEEYERAIDEMLREGYIRKAITYLLINIPAQNKRPNQDDKAKLKQFYKKYLSIFLPELTLCQMQ